MIIEQEVPIYSTGITSIANSLYKYKKLQTLLGTIWISWTSTAFNQPSTKLAKFSVGCVASRLIGISYDTSSKVVSGCFMIGDYSLSIDNNYALITPTNGNSWRIIIIAKIYKTS